MTDHNEELESQATNPGGREQPQIKSEPQLDLVGRTLGDFEVFREVGRGGMALVYEARQRTLKRSVALKVLLPSFVSRPGLVQRFHREAEAAASLHHPNIMPIYVISEHEGVHYFAMEYIDGETVKDVIERRRRSLLRSKRDIPQDEVLKIGLETAKALEHAHKIGVIHRDVKPANIMVARGGRIVVTDFGIAKSMKESAGDTTGFLGTPVYMSPEQARGDKVDVRTDIYSLGCVLYEMLTGEPPFAGDSPLQVIDKVKNGEPPRIRSLNPAVSENLERVVEKAMANELPHRYPSVAMFLRDLERVQHGESIEHVVREPAEVAKGTASKGKKKKGRKAPGKGMRKRFPLAAGLMTIFFSFSLLFGGAWLLLRAFYDVQHRDWIEQQFQMAQNAILNGTPQLAVEYYKRVVERYPDSPEGDQAQKFIIQIRATFMQKE